MRVQRLVSTATAWTRRREWAVRERDGRGLCERGAVAREGRITPMSVHAGGACGAMRPRRGAFG